MQNQVTLGDKVEDIITGFEGLVVARVEYLNGCVQFGVKPKSVNGKYPETVFIDEAQLQRVDGGVAVEQKQTGGENMPAPTGIGLST